MIHRFSSNPVHSTRDKSGISGFNVAMALGFLFTSMGSNSTAWAADPSEAAMECTIAVQTLNGDTLHGNLLSFDSSEGLRLEFGKDDQVIQLPVSDVLRISNHVKARNTSPAPMRIDLVGGDQLMGKPLGEDADHVWIETPHLGKLRIPLAHIVRWTTIPARLQNARAVQSYVPPAVRTLGAASSNSAIADDRLWVTNGDMISGIITAIDERGFSVISNAEEEMLLPHDRVLMAMPVSGSAPPRTESALRVELQDGSVLTVNDWKFVGAGPILHAASPYGRITALGWRSIETLEPFGGRWTWLATLEPISAAHQSLTGTAWETQPDRNVLGQPLRVAGQEFDHGLGTHSASVLVFDLKGDYVSFVTHYGMDDNSGPLAEVDINIRVDGQVRHTESGLRAGKLIGPVRLDVSGASRLELIVDPGRNGDVQDRFNWIDCGLVHK